MKTEPMALATGFDSTTIWLMAPDSFLGFKSFLGYESLALKERIGLQIFRHAIEMPRNPKF